MRGDGMVKLQLFAVTTAIVKYLLTNKEWF